MKRITLNRFNKLKLKDLTNKRFCDICGKKLITHLYTEKFDAVTGNSLIVVDIAKCTDADQSFYDAGVSAFARPPKHSLPVKCITYKITE